MKKIILVLVVFAGSLVLVSCNKNKAACWQVTETITYQGETSKMEFFVYGLESDVDAEIEQAKQEMNERDIEATFTKTKVSKAESDCVTDLEFAD